MVHRSLAGVVLFCAAGVAAQAPASMSLERPGARVTLVVLPFENNDGLPKLDWLAEGLAELTIERLARLGQNALPREEWLAALDRLGLPASPRLSRATMLKLGEEADANWVIFGHYVSNGETLAVTAQLLRISPPDLLPPIEESGALVDLMDLHARLVGRVLASVQPRLPLRGGDLLRLRLDAFELYTRGLLSADPEKDSQRLRLLREAARLEPTWEDPAFALGEAYFARRDCESALPWLSRVSPAHARGLEARFAVGVCHLLRKDPTRAEAAFTDVLEQVLPEHAGKRELPEALNNLGVARERLGKTQEAMEAFERAAKADPEDADYWFNLAVARLRMKELPAAIESLREALRRQPRDATTRTLLIAALKENGRGAEATAEEEKWASQGGKPDLKASLSPEALAALGRIKMRLDRAALHAVPEARGSAGNASHAPRGVRAYPGWNGVPDARGSRTDAGEQI